MSGASAVLVVDVRGLPPEPQGSIRAVPTARGPRLTSDNPRLGPWRWAVTWQARLAVAAATWPCDRRSSFDVSMGFTLWRPASAPAWRVDPIVRPDLDKLVRGVLDALTAAKVWADDSQVVSLSSRKRYAGSPREIPGVLVHVTRES